MYPRLFLAILPAFLGAIVPSLAVPIQSSDSVSVEARSFDLSSEAAQLVSRDIVEESLVERNYQDDESNVLARAVNEDIYPRAKKPKLTAAASKARKDNVRADVAHKQGANAAKKTHLKGEAAKLTKPYGKPRKPKYTKETTAKGKTHITGGYRSDARAKGHRLPKQPKTPHANFAKGDHLKNPKAGASHAAAKARQQKRKADGRAKFGHAAATHKETLKHGNMPGRKDEFHVPNHGVLHGKDARQGAFHLALHNGKGGKYPVGFRNDEQGPATNRHKPLPHMAGSGHEYPVQKGGYHPGGATLGPARGIFQENPKGADGKHKGFNLQGIVSHDVTLPKGHPGYNDHIAIPRLPHIPKSIVKIGEKIL